eukprot:gnl/MRDRNA2_/MRDRNA2_124846_c0_seq1.p1 gnl/MRDRNA2_/MRDRNA2_124846_c0~~gnl/MRDRNA2_/MRDRNA2_124846_c0_seq1.p1  ORF type:complete len:105 (+),score=14.01 gnl/MRDRNA2_/MRDRNA2_124846_c0_seq1:358-672(+)
MTCFRYVNLMLVRVLWQRWSVLHAAPGYDAFATDFDPTGNPFFRGASKNAGWREAVTQPVPYIVVNKPGCIYPCAQPSFQLSCQRPLYEETFRLGTSSKKDQSR